MLAGTELRKERRLSEVLSDSFNILFAHWRSIATIAMPLVVANVAFSLVILALTPDLATAEEIDAGAEFISSEDIGPLIALGVIALIAIPIFFALSALVGGAAVLFLDQADNGTPMSPSEALDHGQNKLRVLVGATLRATAIVLLLCCTIVGIPFAIYRSVRWIFISQVVMIDGKSGEDVLAGSAALVQGRWWNTMGRLIVAALVIGIPVGALQQAFLAISPGIAGTILSSLMGFVTISYGIISLTLMYFDLKARKAAAAAINPDSAPPLGHDRYFPTG